MFNKLKQFKDLSSQANQLQDMLAKEEVEGSAASGQIKIIMDGNQKVIQVKIDQESMSQNDSLETALAEAFNDAAEKAKKIMINKFKDIGLPGGMDLPGM